jgi:hypothetical protein
MWQSPFQAQDDDERQRRLDAQDFSDTRYWRRVVIGGVVALVAWVVLAFEGWPGTGVILVPIALGTIIFGGIQLLVNR